MEDLFLIGSARNTGKNAKRNKETYLDEARIY